MAVTMKVSFSVTLKELQHAHVTGDMGVPTMRLHKCDFYQVQRLHISQKEAGASRFLSPKCQLLRDIVNQFPTTVDDKTALV